MYSDILGIQDRLEEILESIELIQEWSKGMTELRVFMISPFLTYSPPTNTQIYNKVKSYSG